MNLMYVYIYRERETKLRHKNGVTLNDITSLNNLLLNKNFDKFTIRLHYIHIPFILAKFHGNQRSIIMLSINYLNSSFLV